jgi:hypothetical protein
LQATSFEVLEMTRSNVRSFLTLVAALCLAVLCALSLTAQDATLPPPPPGPGGPGGAMMHGPGGGIGEGNVVTSIPLTAQVVVTHENTLSDGNHISRTEQTTIYRDSQGRVRREMTVDATTTATGRMKHSIITINDPVSGNRYMLDPTNKTARLMPSRPPHGRGGPPKDTDGLAAGAVKSALSKNVQRDQLGTKTIDGYAATGERVTRTIPAGEIGNEKPIEVVTERWFSSDLQLPLLVVHNDPLMGAATTKVTNVNRGEPDASLFQVPSDYKVVSGRRDEPFYVPLKP